MRISGVCRISPCQRGSRLVNETERHATRALFDALNPLLGDRLDHASIPGGVDIELVEKRLLETVKAEHNQQKRGAEAQAVKRRHAEGKEFAATHFPKESSMERLAEIPAIPDEVISLLSSDLRAALNTMLHISDNVAKGEVCPGNMFFMKYGSPRESDLNA